MPVLVFGSVNADLVFALPALPGPGETVLGPRHVALPGGKGANQAVAAARDGAPTAFAGAVGADPLAEVALAGLREAGVDLARLAIAAAPTGCAAIAVDPAGRNQIAVGSGANLLARAAQVEDAALTPATLLLLQMEVPAAETAALVMRARARGARVLLNLAPAAALDRAALAALDLLVANEHEAAWLAARLGCGAEAAALHRALGIGVAVTRGEAGAEAMTAAGPLRVPAFPVRAVDTTGAGDAWCGVLAAALERGLPLEAAMRRASAAAALACTRAGAAMPRAAETDALLRQGG
ncbi:PfkB family carbohydrate kinase [Paracraurococcus lichenis]|uniref:Ribokinase n=1 Tax=Paracraurococcus lichenis TaxID=3064888 RepID=A0ABT9E4Z1_9PROT|nr:PfkB family carbohydrate kinase [Paracraurococcus sp. LOR1-02]MDO9711221.1 PfkB family carbohydrate kinase [Paracraurococcus sp. LOR1-02]